MQIYIFITWFILLLITTSLTKIFFEYDTNIVSGILVELHGVVFEILFIVILFEFFKKSYFKSKEKKVISLLKPKLTEILNTYGWVYRYLNQVDSLNETPKPLEFNLNNAKDIDFKKKPSVAPFDGNIADFIKFKIILNEKKINSLIQKYVTVLDQNLLAQLESLIDHPLSIHLKMISDVCDANKRHEQIYYYKWLCEDMVLHVKEDFMNFSIILNKIDILIGCKNNKTL